MPFRVILRDRCLSQAFYKLNVVGRGSRRIFAQMWLSAKARASDPAQEKAFS